MQQSITILAKGLFCQNKITDGVVKCALVTFKQQPVEYGETGTSSIFKSNHRLFWFVLTSTGEGNSPKNSQCLVFFFQSFQLRIDTWLRFETILLVIYL